MIPKHLAAFLLLVSLLLGSSHVSADTVLVPSSSTWKYLDNGSDQGTAWRSTSFSDAGWASGPAELGYGDASEGRPEATLVSYGPDANNRYITTYFRHTFNVADATAYGSLLLRVIRDDGVVVYLNGVEIARNNVGTGTVGYRTLAPSAVGSADEYTYVDFVIPATQLRSGANLLAVEIHQANATSTDVSFDLELIGRPPGLVRQPYLQVGTPTSVTIRWRSDVATDSVVRYGPRPDNLTAQVVQDQTSPKTEHEIRLTGLSPDTRYYYSVGSSAATYASGEACVFYTSPPPGKSHPTRIWAIGDAGTGTANQTAVRDAYYAVAAGSYTDVMLMLGDNVYETGTDIEYTTRHFNVYQDILRRTVTWPTIGNHDTASLTSPSPTIPYYNSFTLPKQAEAGGIPSGSEDYYSFDYGDIHFVCLDSMTENRATTGPMVTWLQQDLASTAQRWIIAYWHHPPYSKGHDSDTDTVEGEMRRNIVPILEDYGVDLVLSGHSHAYERSYLMNGHYGTSSTYNVSTMRLDGTNGQGEGGYNKPTLNGAGREGAVYTVAGSSGKTQNYTGISDNGTGNGVGHPAMLISWERLGSLIIDVDGNRMDVQFLRENGTVGDFFTITHGPRVNASPVASITQPGNGSEFNQGAPITVRLNGTDTDQGLGEFVLYANESRIATLPASGNSSSVDHTWTPPGLGNYRLQVRAVDLLGSSGVSSPVDVVVSVGAPAPDTTPPAAVANLTGTAGIDQISLTWRAPGDDGADTGAAASYDIRHSLIDPIPGTDMAAWWSAASPVGNPPVPQVSGSPETYTVTGLSPRTNYFIALKATDDEGNVSGLSNVATIRTLTAPPAAPTNLTAVNGANGVVLNWMDNSLDEDGFSIERSLSGTGGFSQLQWVPADTTTHTDQLTYAGSTYYYRVLATNGDVSSTATNVAKVTLPPAAPQNLQGTATTTEITLTWEASGGAQSYTIARRNPQGGFDTIASGSSATTHTDSGLSSGTAYTYQVSAINVGGAGPASDVTVQTATPNPPQAPASLTASAISTSAIYLEWVNAAGTQTQIEVERSGDGINFESRAAIAGSATTFTDNGLSSGTAYWYRVRASNADGTSPYSNTAAATTLTPQPPSAPTNLSGVADAEAQITLSWVDTSSNEGGFYVESASGANGFSPVATLPAGAQSFVHTGLQKGASYRYRVQAYNADGSSAYSNEITVATLPPQPPAAPTGLGGEAVSGAQIRLTWSDASNNETGFYVESASGQNSFTQIASLPAGTETFTHTGLLPGATYRYRVQAYNDDGVASSPEISVATLAPPSSPTLLNATPISKTQINLSWTDTSSNEQGFHIERSTDQRNWTQFTVGSNVTTFASSGLSSNKMYHFRVRAYNTEGTSSYTPIVSAKTPKQ